MLWLYLEDPTAMLAVFVTVITATVLAPRYFAGDGAFYREVICGHWEDPNQYMSLLWRMFWKLMGFFFLISLPATLIGLLLELG